jgi:antirestriction protein ArdC
VKEEGSGYQDRSQRNGSTLYNEVTDRIIAQIEEGTRPWVRPWDDGRAELGLPRNAGTGRRYSGINVLILWHRLFEQGYGSQRWLTYRHAQAMD